MNADSAAWGNIFRHVKFNRAVAVPASLLSFKAFLPPFRGQQTTRRHPGRE